MKHAKHTKQQGSAKAQMTVLYPKNVQNVQIVQWKRPPFPGLSVLQEHNMLVIIIIIVVAYITSQPP